MRRLIKALSYRGSVVLDFFAGSGVTLRVAIEEGRHSVVSDVDPSSARFVEEQLATLDEPSLFEGKRDYAVVDVRDFKNHPVFATEVSSIVQNGDGE